MTIEEGKEWKKLAIRLNKCLNRFDEDCDIMSHHNKKEFHEAGEVCSVLEELYAAKAEFQSLMFKSVKKKEDFNVRG